MDMGSNVSSTFVLLLALSASFVFANGEGQISHESVFTLDEKTVYVSGKPILGVDRNSFEILSPYYGKDKNHVYLGQQIIDDADPGTFLLIQPKKFERNELGIKYFYSADISNVYFLGRPIDGAIPETFSVLGHGYSKDANNVWKESKLLKDVDSQSFYVLGGSYTADKENVYFHDKIITGVDVSSFQVLQDSRFTKDNKQAE